MYIECMIWNEKLVVGLEVLLTNCFYKQLTVFTLYCDKIN
jgi:hypothetical protein